MTRSLENMAIIVNLDVMLAHRKMKAKTLAEQVGITEQNISLLKSGKVKGVRFDTLEKFAQHSVVSPAICWNIAQKRTRAPQVT